MTERRYLFHFEPDLSLAGKGLPVATLLRWGLDQLFIWAAIKMACKDTGIFFGVHPVFDEES